MNMRRVVAVVMLAGVLGSCVRIPPSRVLPNTIHSIYIPIFENQSYEPGLEEKLTRLAVEEFLADGRLDVVRRGDADVVLVGKLEKFDVGPTRFGVDDFPLINRITLIADVLLYDPSDRQKQKPLMAWNNIDVEYTYISDTRRSDIRDLGSRGVIEGVAENAYEDALRQLARQIVSTVITRKPIAGSEVTGLATAPTPPPPKSVLGREKVDTRFVDIRSSESLPVEEPGTRRERPQERPPDISDPGR
jgi:hypothetical protein